MLYSLLASEFECRYHIRYLYLERWGISWLSNVLLLEVDVRWVQCLILSVITGQLQELLYMKFIELQR